MIPLTILYDEYIDRPKLTEQKKPVEYIVPPSPLKWESEQKCKKCDESGEKKNFTANKRKHYKNLAHICYAYISLNMI